ncbi:MAG: hypothetical protein BZ151_02975 [Desulfobacca sp. 4484_104]|nr:MAG: hypothetical protein BZ151_02975 [Desulfobacca sp. 4484_104]RLA90021.1 MAG: hypothetical protein DRG58_03405 [Deltaproteobacteria bacterium]
MIDNFIIKPSIPADKQNPRAKPATAGFIFAETIKEKPEANRYLNRNQQKIPNGACLATVKTKIIRLRAMPAGVLCPSSITP